RDHCRAEAVSPASRSPRGGGNLRRETLDRGIDLDGEGRGAVERRVRSRQALETLPTAAARLVECALKRRHGLPVPHHRNEQRLAVPRVVDERDDIALEPAVRRVTPEDLL